MKNKVLHVRILEEEKTTNFNYPGEDGLTINIEFDLSRALKELKFKHYDLLLISAKNFGIEIAQFLYKIKDTGRLIHLPILVCFENGTEAEKIKTIEIGAHDCMIGNMNLKEVYLKMINLIKLSCKYSPSENPQNEISFEVSISDKFMERVNNCIDENLSDENMDLPFLSETLKLSKSAIQKKIKKQTGKSVSVYIREYRLKQAQIMIEKAEFPISKIVELVGFGGASYFSKCYKDYFGFTPSKRNID